MPINREKISHCSSNSSSTVSSTVGSLVLDAMQSIVNSEEQHKNSYRKVFANDTMHKFLLNYKKVTELKQWRYQQRIKIESIAYYVL